jgi:hypothetical protein
MTDSKRLAFRLETARWQHATNKCSFCLNCSLLSGNTSECPRFPSVWKWIEIDMESNEMQMILWHSTTEAIVSLLIMISYLWLLSKRLTLMKYNHRYLPWQHLEKLISKERRQIIPIVTWIMWNKTNEGSVWNAREQLPLQLFQVYPGAALCTFPARSSLLRPICSTPFSSSLNGWGADSVLSCLALPSIYARSCPWSTSPWLGFLLWLRLVSRWAVFSNCHGTWSELHWNFGRRYFPVRVE